MFFRQKKSGNRVYLQIVENRWKTGARNNALSPPSADSINSDKRANWKACSALEPSSAKRSCCWPLIDAARQPKCGLGPSDRP